MFSKRYCARLGKFACAAMIMAGIWGTSSTVRAETAQPVSELVLTEAPVHGTDARNSITKLNETADAMYRNVAGGNIFEARKQLAQMEKIIETTGFDGLTVEGIEALTSSVVDAKRAFNSLTLPHDQAVLAAARIRLATDAVAHPKNPMWLQYYKIVTDDLDRIADSVKRHDANKSKSALQDLKQHISVIRPALLINRAPYQVEMVDSFLIFLQSQLSSIPVQAQTVDSGIKRFKAVVNDLFMKKEAPAYLPVVPNNNPWIGSIWIGLAIITALTYVGWKKYRAERDYTRVRREPGHLDKKQ